MQPGQFPPWLFGLLTTHLYSQLSPTPPSQAWEVVSYYCSVVKFSHLNKPPKGWPCSLPPAQISGTCHMAKPFLHTASWVRTNPNKPPCQPCSDHQVIFRSSSNLGRVSLVSALWSSLPNWVPPSPFFQGWCDKVCLPNLAEQTCTQKPGWGWGLASPVFPWCLTHNRCSVNNYCSNKQTQQLQCQSVTSLQNCKRSLCPLHTEACQHYTLSFPPI